MVKAKSNKKNKSGKSGKKVAKKVVEKVQKPVELKAPVVENNVLDKYSENFQLILNQLTDWRSNITQMISEVRRLEKQVLKEIKSSQKKSKKNKDKPKREPSGFAKPTKISSELCDFLSKPYGTEMARTEVTKYLTTYIKKHNLQFQADKRKIVPDKKLAALLGVGKTDEVTYFNLQKWMKPHFSTAAAK